MTTAEQARRMATSPKTTKRFVNKELKIINEYIQRAAQRGGTSISYHINYYNYTKDIVKKLEEVGYHVSTGYNDDVIEIDWSETK